MTTIRFNFLKLLDRILLYLFRRRYVITFLMTSRLRHHCVVSDNIMKKISVFLVK